MKRPRASLEDSSLEEPLINLTPLIDVVFVVLISFMLIAPVLHLDHVELAEAGGEKVGAAPASSALTIHVKADNTIWFQGKPLSMRELEEKLRQEKKSHPRETPQLIQDQNASFGTYQTVKNTLERCGFDQMDVVLSPAR